ncbi:MAG: hypothetical protein R2883_05150 [Caldisericia bacterium]
MKFEKNVKLYPKGRVEIDFTDRDKKIYLYVDESIAEVVEDGKTTKIQIDPENDDVVPFHNLWKTSPSSPDFLGKPMQ